MATIEIPESLGVYYDNKAVRRAVNELVGKLDGAGMPDCDWEEAKNYSQALLMAAQIRADYVAPLFDVWEATFSRSFGRSDAQRFMGEYFDHEHLSPSQIWKYGWLWQRYYRDGRSDKSGRYDDFCVILREARLDLRVFQYNQNGEMNGSGMPTVEGWSTQHDDIEGGLCLANEGVKFADFLSEPVRVMDRFASDAANVIEALLET